MFAIRLLAAVWMCVSTAQAQEDAVNFELFRPFPDAYGYLGVPSAATLGHLQLGVSFWGNYSNDPLVLVYGGARSAPLGITVDGDSGDGIVDDRMVSNLQVGMGLSRFFSLSADVPLVLWQDGYGLADIGNPLVQTQSLLASGVGDVSIQPKIVFLDRDRAPLGMSVAVPVTLPTAGARGFIGEAEYSAAPNITVELSDGSIHKRDYTVRLAFVGGYRFRQPTTILDVPVENEALYGLALGVHPSGPLELMIEYRASNGGELSAQQPAEVMGGMKFIAGPYASFNIGGGAGVRPGMGSPDYRFVVGFSAAPSFDPNTRDTDSDGVVDALDGCPKEPEDLDGYRDEDGCPELDNDSDGYLDYEDGCPNDAEDFDQFEDEDGCPDVDNDRDGIADSMDRCPDQPETSNDYMDDDGCPDEAPAEDTDGDGYGDDVDRCPYDAEDFDEFEDEDGCPDDDNDNDGIPDISDGCPNDREVFNGVEDEDGCPDEGRVIIERDEIRILEKIYFEFGKSEIQERSFSLLDEIAVTIVEHPELIKIRVEGHTDAVGGDVSNLRLSQNRADSVVNALVSRGVERGRLDGVGFGEMRPISSNETDSGRSENRRVEFIIVERD